MMIQIVPAIKQLSLTRVGCWKNVIVDFTPGLNIITGDCGCGKSSILRAMLHAVHPLHQDRYSLTPTYPFTSGTIGIEFNRDSVVLDISLLAGIPEKTDVYESHGQFMLMQLHSYITGVTCRFARLIEDVVTAGLDDLQFRQAVEALLARWAPQKHKRLSGGLFCGCKTGCIGNRGYLPIDSCLTLRLDNRSWMTGDCHVQFSESARVRLPRATRLMGG